jgi:hypothetical protein
MRQSTGSGVQDGLTDKQQVRRDPGDILELVERIVCAGVFVALGYWGWSDTRSLAVWERLLAEWIPLVVTGVFLVLAGQSLRTLLKR